MHIDSTFDGGGVDMKSVADANNTARRVRISTSRDNEVVALDVPEMEPMVAYELHHTGNGATGKVRVIPPGAPFRVRECMPFVVHFCCQRVI